MRIALAALLLLLSSCAHPPDRIERDVALEKAVEPCVQKHPGSRITSINRDGRVSAVVSEHRDLDSFVKCANEAIARSEVRSIEPGRLAAAAAHSRVALQGKGPNLFVPVVVNGVPATLLLDTGATLTILHPKLAQRAGIETPLEARRVRTTVVGGTQLRMPVARARSITVQSATVEAIDVAVYDALPQLEGVDGILGNNFLNHFTLTIDRQQRALLLVPQRAQKPF